MALLRLRTFCGIDTDVCIGSYRCAYGDFANSPGCRIVAPSTKWGGCVASIGGVGDRLQRDASFFAGRIRLFLLGDAGATGIRRFQLAIQKKKGPKKAL